MSWHVIPADILSAMSDPSHKNSFRGNAQHTDGLSPLSSRKTWQYILPSAKVAVVFVDHPFSEKAAINGIIKGKRGVFGGLAGLYRAGFRKIRQKNRQRGIAISMAASR